MAVITKAKSFDRYLVYTVIFILLQNSAGIKNSVAYKDRNSDYIERHCSLLYSKMQTVLT